MSKKVLANIDGVELTMDDFNEFTKSIPEQQRSIYLSNPIYVEQFIEQMIAVYLFEKYAEDLALDEEESFKKEIAAARRSILSNMAMNQVIDGISVTEEEKKAYFDTHKDQFIKGETVHAKHILMEAEENIKKVEAMIAEGKMTFEEAAKEYSTCPSGQNGGDLGEFGRGMMVKPFEDAAFAAEIGVVIGPVQTQFGYHLIRVEAHKTASDVTYEDIEKQVEAEMIQAKEQEVYLAKVEELKAKYCR